MERPHRVFDAHLHVIDPHFTLVENDGYLPPPFTVDDYRAQVAPLGIAGGAVVSGSFQAFDQTYLVDALGRLGPSYVGVTQLPGDVADAEVLALDAAGVRAVRFNLRRGGSAGLADLERLARRVHEVAGWHSELYVDARELGELHELLGSLPAVSIDHLGLHPDGLPDLLRLVEGGARVKATGFGRVELDPVSSMRAILRVNPEALLFGTDLPSTRARRPFAGSDLEVVAEAVGPELLDAVLWGNAARWYRLPGAATRAVASYRSTVLDESLVTEAYGQGVEKIVVGAVVHDRGRVLVVTRSPEDGFLPGIDELPSGGVHAGESLAEGLNREMQEEIGFSADRVDDGFLATFDYVTGSGRAARQFTVSVARDGREVGLSAEHSRYRWVALKDLETVSLTEETKAVLAAWFTWAASNREN